MKHLYRIPLIAFFLFVMTGIVINHHTTYGQIPTPTLQPLPSGLPTLLPKPTGIPTLQPLPSGLPPTLLPKPSGIPSLPPIPGGNGAIFGFINDENDNALAGVTVTLDGASFSDSVTTDVDGLFQFNNLAAGDYTLTCEKDGYQTYTQNISLGDHDIQDLGTIVLSVVVKAQISGYVVDIDGNPIENARIKAKGLTTGYISNTATDADGYFEFTELDADTYVVIAKAKGYKRAKTTVKLGEGESQEVEITLKKTSNKIIKAAAR